MALPSADNLPILESGKSVLDPLGGQGTAVLNGPQKAAIVIALLGPEAATPLVDKIGDMHLKKFISAYESLKMIPREALNDAVMDFLSDLAVTSTSLKGGPKEARQLVEDLLDDQRVERIFGSAQLIEEEVEDTSNIWMQLSELASDQIAKYLDKKRPEMISIVLGKLSTDKAGEVLAELSDDVSIKVVNSLTKPGKVDPMTLSTIGKVIEAELLSIDPADIEDSSPLKSVSEIFSVLPSERRENLMDHLTNRDEVVAEEVRKGIITFEDIPDRLPRNGVPIMFREMNQETLLKALKYSQESMPGTLEYLYGNISQRMAEQYREQVADMPEVSRKDGEAAQSAFMSLVSRLDKEGTIALIKVVEATEE